MATAKKTSKTKTEPSSKKPFTGLRFAFFGKFAIWPSYHGGDPATVARRFGAEVSDTIDEKVDRVVFGDRRGSGRAEAKKRAERLAQKGGKTARLQILDEAEYRELVRIDLRGKRFAFAGGFDCSPSGLEDGLLARMVEGTGAVVASDVDAALDYLVIGNRRGPSKVALQNRADKLNDEGAAIAKIDESAFLELVRVDRPTEGGALDFAGFISQLYGHVNEGKLGRALAMLRADRFKLFARVDDQQLVGVVRSQSGSGSVYASWLTADGAYGCSTPELSECMGIQGSTCKHLMVLVVGLARAGQVPLPQALAWMRAANGKGPRDNNELCAETLIQYKGAEAGQIDWRPTETIPEDFYAI
ncbi:MAG TPA: hypothetical protein VN903_09620 [Polyangia bacterium]|nr:hypothetical protein [Polyangia bacterium]